MPSSKNVLILTADKFEDLELLYPFFRLTEAGVPVDVAAPDKREIRGEHGYTLNPTLPIGEADPEKYDLLIIPGGAAAGAPATVQKNRHARILTLSFFDRKKPVAAICHAPGVLAHWDLVKNRHLTSYWNDGVPEEIKTAGGIWEDREVVVDGNLITSRWPMDLPAFMKEIMKVLAMIA
jgi:protease I